MIRPLSSLALGLSLALFASSCGIMRSRQTHYEPFTTDLGVHIQDLVVPAEQAIAATGDRVTIDYEVRLADDTVVDSTHQRGQPISFVLGRRQVPAGLEDGVVGMCRLGRRLLTIPPALAYGAAGKPPDVPPNAVLKIEVELLSIEPGAVPLVVCSDHSRH